MTTLPVGELVLERYDWTKHLPVLTCSMRVLRADPVIRMTDELLHSITISQEVASELGQKPLATYDGLVLRIFPTEGPDITYRLVAYEADRDSWLFAWPD